MSLSPSPHAPASINKNDLTRLEEPSVDDQDPASLVASPPSLHPACRSPIETTRLVERLVVSPHQPAPPVPQDCGPPTMKQTACMAVMIKARPAMLLLMSVLTFAVVGGWLIKAYHTQLLRACEWMQAAAPASLLIYCLVVVAWILVCLPATVVEVTAGFIFGFYIALPAVMVAKVLACCLAFGIGRLVAGDSFKHGISSSSSLRARAIILAMERHPWKITMLLRLCYLPIAVKNYAMALLPCPFHIYLTCTIITALIYTPLLTHLGSSSRSLINATDGGHGHDDKAGGGANPVEVVLLCLSVGVVLLLVWTLKRLSNKYLEQAEREEEEHICQEQGSASSPSYLHHRHHHLSTSSEGEEAEEASKAEEQQEEGGIGTFSKQQLQQPFDLALGNAKTKVWWRQGGVEQEGGLPPGQQEGRPVLV